MPPSPDGYAARPDAEQAPVSPAAFDTADDLLADLLVRMWSLASGRALPAGTRPDQLTEAELIAFWADDMTPVSGRHGLASETS